MRKVGIASVILALLLVVGLGGCLSINAPASRQLMSITTTTPLFQAGALASFFTENVVQNIEPASSVVWADEIKKMVSHHSDIMKKHYENTQNSQVETTSSVAEKNANRYISYDEMLLHHDEMHNGTGSYYCNDHRLYTDSENFSSHHNSSRTYVNSYSGRGRGSCCH